MIVFCGINDVRFNGFGLFGVWLVVGGGGGGGGVEGGGVGYGGVGG